MGVTVIVPDFSHHQSDNNLAMEWLDTTGTHCIILKATEGTTYTDPMLTTYVSKFLDTMKRHGAEHICTIGLYHFCRADNISIQNDTTMADRAVDEMRNFSKAILSVQQYVTHNTNCMGINIVPILDWEGKSIHAKCGDVYLNTCIQYIWNKWNVFPLIYLSASTLRTKTIETVNYYYPQVEYWVAHYGVRKPSYIDTWIAWQFTSMPFDLSFIRYERFITHSVQWGVLADEL